MNFAAARRAIGEVDRRRDTGTEVLIVEPEAGDGVSALVVDGRGRAERVLRSQLEALDQPAGQPSGTTT